MNWKVAAQLLLIACFAMGAMAGDRTKPASTTSAQRPYVFGEGEYRMGPEDVVQVFVWHEADLSTTAQIRPDGKLSLPLVGEIEATGKTATDLQNEITQKLKQFVTNPVVNVTIKEVNSPKISVLGQVRKPNAYKIRQRITALDAIALAGGFTDWAKKDHVTVIRSYGTEQTRIQLDLKHMLKEGQDRPFYLEPGDTVYVE